jgi:hypothetical protein
LLASFQVHLAKPVDPHELTAVIASLCGPNGNIDPPGRKIERPIDTHRTLQ